MPGGEVVGIVGGGQMDIHDHGGNVQAGIAAVLFPMPAVTASID
jgi:hypothetical protein